MISASGSTAFHGVSLPGIGLASQEVRLTQLNDALKAAVAALCYLKDRGIAKTNFMECDQCSIYVFQYLFEKPLQVISWDLPVVARFKSSRVLSALQKRLEIHGLQAASPLLETLRSECTISMLSEAELLNEERIALMVYYMRLLVGILKEVCDKGLIDFPEVDLEEHPLSRKLFTLTHLFDHVRLSHLSPDQMIDRINVHLNACGFAAVADLISKYKGHPDLLDAL